jgi:hypothetical protein
MTDHAWAQEQIAAAVAGGLTAAEAERFDAHIRDCPECATALADARNLDRGLGTLFADVRPGPMLADRTIDALRAAKTRRRILSGWKGKLAVGLAASVGLGAIGAGVAQMAERSGLVFPGDGDANGRIAAVNNLKQLALTGHLSDAEDPGSRDSQGRTVEALDDAASMAAKRASSLGRMDWFETINGSQPGWRYRSAEGREEKNVPQKGAEPADPADGSKATITLPGALQFGGFPRPVQGLPQLSAGTTFYKESGASTSVAGAGERSPVPGPFSYFMGYDGRPPTAGQATSATEGKGKDGIDLGSQWGKSLGYINPAEHKPLLLHSDAEEKAGKKIVADQTPVRGVPMNQRPESGVAAAGDLFVQAGQQPPRPQNPEPAAPRKIIRSGEIDFEVESFDSAVATVTKLVTAINNAFVATVNSEKLPNGKVKGSMVVRVPPDSLDSLVLDLRQELGKGGELRGQRIGSQEITKQYTDLNSRLKAAKTMQERLLQMIKEGKGEIKQLLEAEKELGVWRTKIEELEGELRYYDNLVSLSTLTITMAEKEIKAAAALRESERIQAGVEVEDVENARQQALTAVAEAKGRVTKSELKQLAAGQFNATLNFEVPPDAAGPVRDRLRQIGRVVRLEIDRVQQAEGGVVTTTPVPRDIKITRGDAQFLVQLYNLANVAPRETAVVQVAVTDVPSGYQKLREAVAKANGRVLAARLDEQDRQNVTAQLDFEVRRADEAAVQTALAAAGDVIARNVTRAPEGDNVTDAKVLFRTVLMSVTRLRPRETTTLAVEVPDVDATVAVIGAHVGDMQGRQVDANVAYERGGRVTARLIYDVPLSRAEGLVARIKSAGVVRVQQSARDPQAPEGKYATARLDVTLSNVDLIVPKDDGLWPQVRRGLSVSVSVLLMSVTWVIFGLCVVVPWALVGYGAYRLIRRLFRPSPLPVTPT